MFPKSSWPPENAFSKHLSERLRNIQEADGMVKVGDQYYAIGAPLEGGGKQLLGPTGLAGTISASGEAEAYGAGYDKPKEPKPPKITGFEVLWDTATGRESRIVPRTELDPRCAACGGTGGVPGTKQPPPMRTCDQCMGTGQVTQGQELVKCDKCKGSGKQKGKAVPAKKCPVCFGSGVKNVRLIQLVNSLRKAGRGPKVRLQRGKPEAPHRYTPV